MSRKRKEYKPCPRTSTPNEKMDGMPAPNHNLAVSVKQEGPYPNDLRQYPVLNMRLPTAQDSGQASHLAFFAKIHGVADWSDNYRQLKLCAKCLAENETTFIAVPPTPTWMDPIVYIMMVKRDERASQAIAAYAKQPTKSSREALAVHLRRILTTSYQKFIEKKFDDLLPQFTRWLAANQLEEGTTHAGETKSTARENPPPAASEPPPPGARVPLPRSNRARQN